MAFEKAEKEGFMEQYNSTQSGYDVSLTDFPRLAGEESDDARILRAVEACERGVLYIPKGVYRIAKMLEVKNCCSLIMHKSAVLKTLITIPISWMM